jgi:Fungal specific transcription factor domain
MTRAVNFPRPPELASHLIGGPIFLAAMTDTGVCLSVLSAAAALRCLREGQPPRSVQLLELYGRALGSVRENLDQIPAHVTDEIILSAVLLWRIQANTRDLKTLKSHANSVRGLVEYRGGLHKLGYNGALAQWIRWISAMTDVILEEGSLYNHIPISVPPSSCPPQTYGSAFQTIKIVSLLDPALVRTCKDLCRVTEILERAQRQGTTMGEYRYVMSMLNYISDCKSVLHSRFKGSGTINECVVPALYVYQTSTFNMPREMKNMVLSATSYIRSAIQRTKVSVLWADGTDILVWVLFMAVLNPNECDDRGWLRNLLQRSVIRKFGDGEWPNNWRDQLHQFLASFVWSDARCSATFGQVCDSISMFEVEKGFSCT